MLVNNAPIITNGDMTSDITSTPIYLEQESLLSIQAVWTGTPVGNFKIQTSDDFYTIDQASLVTHWTDYTGSTQAAGGAAGNVTWRIADAGDRWYRVVYTAGSSSGTVNARYQAKEI
jgi:hypothetical protein